MKKKDEAIWSHLTGIELPENQGKDVKPPTAGEIYAWVRDVDAEEMRRYMAHPRYGTTFKTNVESAVAEYRQNREAGQ